MNEEMETEVLTTEHVWQQIMVIDNVEVIPDPDDRTRPAVINKASQIVEAQDRSAVGCLMCNVSLDEGWGKPCPGPNLEKLDAGQ